MKSFLLSVIVPMIDQRKKRLLFQYLLWTRMIQYNKKSEGFNKETPRSKLLP
jgi:hypothetical protein